MTLTHCDLNRLNYVPAIQVIVSKVFLKTLRTKNCVRSKKLNKMKVQPRTKLFQSGECESLSFAMRLNTKLFLKNFNLVIR